LANIRARATAALLASCLPALLLLPAETAVAQDTEIRVICSNGIRAAVEKLLPEYERTLGRSIKAQFGSSAELKRSIQGGAPFDLAILTPAVIDDLIKQGKIAEGTAVDLATTGVGFAIRAGVPKPDVGTSDGIKQLLLHAKSVGYVKEGAGTPAIVGMLNALGLAEDVQRKTVFQPGAEQSMASVAGGQVDVAFALISEIIPASGVQLAGPLPPEFQKRITMSAGISSSTKNRAAASEIIKSLTGAAAGTTIKATGLDPVSGRK
jgi:molybdate transport system substrate-binding protein